MRRFQGAYFEQRKEITSIFKPRNSVLSDTLRQTKTIEEKHLDSNEDGRGRKELPSKRNQLSGPDDRS
jgi:hypothetical protein